MKISLHLRVLGLSAVLLTVQAGAGGVAAQEQAATAAFPPSTLEIRRESLRQRERAEALARKQRLVSRQRAFAEAGGKAPQEAADFVTQRLPSALRVTRIAISAAVASVIGVAAASAVSSDVSPFGEASAGSSDTSSTTSTSASSVSSGATSTTATN